MTVTQRHLAVLAVMQRQLALSTVTAASINGIGAPFPSVLFFFYEVERSDDEVLNSWRIPQRFDRNVTRPVLRQIHALSAHVDTPIPLTFDRTGRLGTDTCVRPYGLSTPK